MPDWIRRTALGDILKQDFSALQDETLYRNLDRLHPNREHIERQLAEKEKTMFDLNDTVYLYDLTSTYFEGQAKANPQAQRGYSRDKRPDCKQVVIGLVLDREGFPKAQNSSTAICKTAAVWTRCWLLWKSARASGRAPRSSSIGVWRLMKIWSRFASVGCIIWLRDCNRREINGSMSSKTMMVGKTSFGQLPRNPLQKKTRVEIQRQPKDGVAYILCRSEGREEKDRAIRDAQEAKLIADLHKLRYRVAKRRLK